MASNLNYGQIIVRIIKQNKIKEILAKEHINQSTEFS